VDTPEIHGKCDAEKQKAIEEGATMKVFRAEPIQGKLGDPRWSRSKHKGWVEIMAENEHQAITLVEWMYIEVRVNPGPVEQLENPWGDKSLVNWTEISDHKYTLEGNPRILGDGIDPLP